MGQKLEVGIGCGGTTQRCKEAVDRDKSRNISHENQRKEAAKCG